MAAPTARRVAPQLGAALLCGLTIVLVSRNAGGWFATTWGWAALALLFVGQRRSSASRRCRFSGSTWRSSVPARIEPGETDARRLGAHFLGFEVRRR